MTGWRGRVLGWFFRLEFVQAENVHVSKLRDGIQGIRNFWMEVIGETKKCEWPARDELLESTAVVIAFVLILAAAVGVFDKILVVLLENLIRFVG